MTASRDVGAPLGCDSVIQHAGNDNAGRGPADEDAMSEEQAATLRRLSQDALEPEAFSRNLSRVEAQRRIEALAAKLRLQDGPPHTL
jgi:hypothetical protein